MWFKRDFSPVQVSKGSLPIKILKGPRQCGKTSLLNRLPNYVVVYLDDASTRLSARENPRLFLDQWKGPVILDEAALAPELFPEMKRRVDEFRRNRETATPIDIWITGSNQTLLARNVQESLAGRASFFDLNTLSLHELGDVDFGTYLMKGGWPELHLENPPKVDRYLNDLISTFIEKDIVATAGIEKKDAFLKLLQLASGRIGQLFNASDLAKTVGVDVLTVQSWMRVLEENAIVRSLRPYLSNRNQRLIKAPKYYFEDVGLAVRLQGWTDYAPLSVSPAMGNLVENTALNEICRFFVNRGEAPIVHSLRTKEQVEIDFLVELPNQRFIAVEAKTTAQDFSQKQMKLLDTLGIQILDRWVVSPLGSPDFMNARSIEFQKIWDELNGACANAS